MKSPLLYSVIYIFTFIVFFLSCSEEPTDIETPTSGIQFNWETTTPQSVGLDSLRIDSALTIADTAGFVRSVLVVKNSKIIAERYYGYNHETSFHDLRSATKSFTSAIVGIAIDKGYMRLNDKIADYLPGKIHADADPRIYNVTIEQILTMKSGIGSDTYFEGITTGYQTALEFVLNTPLQANPGERYLYSSNSNFLLTAAFPKATGKTALEFANEYLCEPLGISIPWWKKDEQGYYFGGGGLYLSTRNAAAFGQLFLRNGYMNGRQIISRDWISESLNNHLEFGTTWISITNLAYGYLWWMGEINEHRIYSAMGYAGQIIMLVPDLDMVLTITCESEVESTTANRNQEFMLKLIQDYIIPNQTDS